MRAGGTTRVTGTEGITTFRVGTYGTTGISIPHWNVWYNRNVGYSRHMQEEPMVGASEAIRKLDIPRVSFYRAVNDGRIPFHEERKPWQKRPVKRFLLSEVRAALEMDTPAPGGPGA